MPGLNFSINKLQEKRVTRPGIDLSYPQRVAIQTNRDGLIFKGLMGKEMLALRLRIHQLDSRLRWFSSLLSYFFSSKKTNDYLIRTIHNGHTSKAKRNKPGTQARASPSKRKEYQYIRFSKRWLLSFPTGVKLLVFFASWLTVSRFATHLQENDF